MPAFDKLRLTPENGRKSTKHVTLSPSKGDVTNCCERFANTTVTTHRH